MPSVAERRRNNVRAGIFVTVTIIVALLVLGILTDAWNTFSQQTRPYVVRFPVTSGVGTVGQGSSVRIGGLELGRVTSVTGHREGEVLTGIDVAFELDTEATLFTDATIIVSEALVGSEGWLDIPFVGTPSEGIATGPIEGATAEGLLVRFFGTEGAAGATRFMEFIGTVPEEFAQRIVPILDDAKAASENVKTTSEDVRAFVERVRDEDWARWSGRVDDLFDWADALASNVNEGVAEGKAALSDARTVINDIRTMVEEQKPSVERIVKNVEDASGRAKEFTDRSVEIAEHVQDTTLPRADELLARGRDATDEAAGALGRLRTDYAGWAEGAEEIVANASLASQQLKLTMIELRRAPWKLIYEPSKKELEHELLYDATRSFALASADLKSAASTMRRVLDDHGDLVANDPALRERVEAGLLGPLARYEQAQSRLLDILFQAGP